MKQTLPVKGPGSVLKLLDGGHRGAHSSSVYFLRGNSHQEAGDDAN
jgi:hypothetical protein